MRDAAGLEGSDATAIEMKMKMMIYHDMYDAIGAHCSPSFARCRQQQMRQMPLYVYAKGAPSTDVQKDTIIICLIISAGDDVV